MKIVVLDGYTENPGDLSWSELEKLGSVTAYDRTAYAESPLIAERIGDAEIVVMNKTPISRETIDKCPNIKLIAVLATGYNVVDYNYAREKGIPVVNVPTYGTASVSQFSIALLLEICHHIGHHSESVHAGNWANNADWCYWDYPLIELAGKTYGENAKDDISIRVITDHIRSCTFMVSDGILPSNEGRGYVLRRLLRRAARHGRMLGITHPFLVELVETVIQSSETAYPELREHDAYIKKVIGTEEANFARTIDAGMNILNNMIDGLEKAHEHLLKGLDVFKLNDTFGFPLDLTKEIAAEQGIAVDEEGFHAEMTKQKERARAERLKKNISGWSEDLFGALDAEPTVFTGYETLNDTGVVVALSDEETLTDAIATDEEAKDGVLVVLAAYAIFRIPVNNAFIAVLLTILGYSVNSTIVIFDRIRENKGAFKRNQTAERINKSISQTLARSINTSLTTLFTIGAIYFLGVPSIQEFALPMMVGIIAGAYSSICISGSIWYTLLPKAEKDV